MLLLPGMSNLQNAANTYAGPDRRRHKVFITRNSEYHCRDGVCVAVVSKRTGDFVEHHSALGLRLAAGMQWDAEGVTTHPETPQPGDQLCFAMIGPDRSPASVITSRVRSIERPPKVVVEKYSQPEQVH
jgi:hypothetical protein